MDATIAGPIFSIEQCPKKKPNTCFFPERSECPWSLYSVTLTFNNSGSFRFNNYTSGVHADSTCRAHEAAHLDSAAVSESVPPSHHLANFSPSHPPFCWGKTAGWQTPTRTPKSGAIFIKPNCLHPNVSLKVLGSDCLSVFQSFDPRSKSAKT